MDDNKGTSLVFINSEKGKKIFKQISKDITCSQVNIDEALKYNPSAYRSVNMPKNRSVFMNLVDSYEFDVLIKNVYHRD